MRESSIGSSMDSIENLVTTFGNSWKERNNDATLNALKDVQGYLKSLTKKDGERALEMLFNERTGILKFLYVWLHKMRKNEMTNFKTSLKEGFSTLQFIMEMFKQEFEPYAEQTRNLCFDCLKSFGWYFTRKAASETFKKLIELYMHLELQLDEIIEYFNTSYLALYTRKDGCVFYTVIGAIARYCPKTENMIQFANEILLQLLKDFKNQCETTANKQTEEIKVYLDCFIDILKNFTPFEEDASKNAEYLEKLFSLLSNLCKSQNVQKTIRMKAVFLISSYMNLFSPFIYKNYQTWHSLFNRLLKEQENYTHIGALRSFYRIMASNLLKDNNCTAFLYFKNYLVSNLCNENLSSNEIRLLIHGLGEFSILYKIYEPSEIYDLFQNIALKTLPYYTKEEDINFDFEAIVEFLKALSQILRHISNISLYHISVITDLSIFFIKKFPELQMYNKEYAINALKTTFVNINHLEKHFQREYFSSFFREGILQSCSHTLLIDIEIQQEITNLKEKPTSYRDYLPLWNTLFKMDGQEFSRILITRIFDEFVSILTLFIEKLNLNVKSQENDVLFNTSFQLQAENETDFWFFINLVDLYVDIFNEIDSDLIQNSVEKLLIFFIKYSYKYPMISGFYKLVEVIFKKPDIFSDYDTSFSKSTCDLIPQYLSDVLKLVCGFSGELQLSCVYLLFNTPLFFVKNLINEMTSVFKVAFSMGLTDLSLAFCALNTLENWIKSLEFQCPNEFLKDIIYYLEPYLSSEESLVDSFQGIEKRRRRNVKSAIVLNDAESLEDFQNRILLFYGSLKTEILFDYVHEKSINTNASWTKKNLLQCDLLFPDIRLKIQFDTFLPRIVELTRSGDIRVKLAACELLHMMITIMLGEKLMDQCFDKNICSTVLRLACDLDDAVRSLYHPFVIQLTHYLSSKLIKDSRAPQDFIDALFEGLTEESHASMRDFCGLYLKEFVQWSIKQFTNADLTNIRSIVRRITSFALYPSNKKRLAAAIAFNNLYIILRENESIVNIYWLQFLHAFVKSMEECDDMQISNALNHVEKVIRVKSNLFIAKSPDRRKPPDFSDETLKGTMIWLFQQCGSTNTKCRQKCMELFERLFPLVSDSDVLKNVCIMRVNEIALKDLEEEFDLITTNNAKIFLRCLHFYIWIFTKKFLSIEISTILQNFSDGNNIFWKCFNQFVLIIINQNVKITATLYTHSTMEAEKIIILTNEVTLEVLNFLSTVLTENGERNIPFNENLYLLITYCIICPSQVELTARKLHIFEKLSSQLKSLLPLMKQHLQNVQLQQFKDIFLKEAKLKFKQFTEMYNIINHKEDLFILKQFVDGLLILKKCEFFDFEQEFDFTFSYLEKKIKEIFKALKKEMSYSEVYNAFVCNILDDEISQYLNKLMKFFLENCQSDVINILNGSIIIQNENLLEIFKESIYEFMLNNPAETMRAFDKTFIEQTDKIFYLVDELLIFAQHHYSEKSEILADELIARCNKFLRQLNGIEKRKTIFFNINKRAVLLKKNPIEAMRTNGCFNDLYYWSFEKLSNSKDLKEKMLFFQNFFISMINEETDDSNNQVAIIFNLLRDEDSEKYMQKLTSNELLKFQATSCFKVLLKMLSNTKSPIVYKGIMNYAAGIYKCLTNENLKEYLTPYFSSISNESALKSLNLAYDLFMELTSNEERLDVLKQFLLPSMELSKSVVVEKFYEDKTNEMLLYVRRDINQFNVNAVDRKKLIVSQLGCYSMFEIMFAKFKVKFGDFNDPVTGFAKPLNQILLKQLMELRFFIAKSEEEKEITRLLHCAALNCCISIVSLKEDEKFYPCIFIEDIEKKQLLWERIIDCKRKYDLKQAPMTIRRERKKLVNIRRSTKDQENQASTASSYFRRYDLASLTLLENVHAYDLNDTRVLPQASSAKPEDECRLDLSFENDELNQHECMPMLVGVLVHLYNSEIATLPESEQHEIPGFLVKFRNGFLTKQDNVRLFLMKIICNTKNVFLRYMPAFYVALGEAVYTYLENNPLNYVVRDILVLFVESKFEPQSEIAQKVSQRLVKYLIYRLPDSSNSVYRYNLEIFESLCKLHSKNLEYPDNLNGFVKLHPNLAIQVVVILLRCGVSFDLLSKANVCELIRTSVVHYKDDEQVVLMRFEAMGWLLHYTDTEACSDDIIKLGVLFQQMELTVRSRCIKCICALYQGCRSETKCKEFFRFARPARLDDEYKARCLELFAQRLPEIELIDLSTELTVMDIKQILRDRVLGCEEPILRIVRKLVLLLTENDLSAYLDLVITGFTGPRTCLLDHRRLAYGILVEAYAKYPAPHAIGKLCRQALAGALTEPAEEIQQLALQFWREGVCLPETCHERLLALLELYTPELHDGFARFLCVLVLELTGKAPDYKQPMFQPLADCSFREYELQVSRRRINWGSMAPLFAPSLASQIHQFSATSTQAGTFVGSLRLLATKDFSFEPTAQFALPQDMRSQIRKLPNPSQNQLSKRLFEERTQSQNVYNEYQQAAVRKRNAYNEKLKKEAEARRNSAKIYRKYRIGDFPDVEVTHATFVESLKQFILKDWLACKSLAVTLICNLLNRLKNSEKYGSFVNSLSTIFKRVLQEKEERNNFAPIVLEIVLHEKEIKVDANVVGKICKTMDLNSLGILLLEEECTYTEDRVTESEAPPNKRMRLDSFNKESWLQLAKLYKSIDMTDVVMSIFRQRGMFSEKLQEAVLAQLEQNWPKATQLYEAAYDTTSDAEKDHCLDGMFESLAELSAWDKINTKTESILKDDFNSVWEDRRKNQLLPWIFEAQLQAALVNFTEDRDPDNAEFLKHFDNWLYERELETKRAFGEEIAMFTLCGSARTDKARHALKCCLEQIREFWIRSSPLSENLRFKALLKLRAMFNINACMEVLKSSDIEESTSDLIKYWDQNSPCHTDELLPWNKLIFYRLSFVQLLHEKIQTFSEDSTLLSDIILAGVRQRLKVSELAIRDKNIRVMKKHLQRTSAVLHELDSIDFSELDNDLKLKAVKYKLISGEAATSAKKKYDYYISSLKVCDELFLDLSVDASTKIHFMYHTIDLMSSLSKAVKDNPELSNYLINDEFVQELLKTPDEENIEKKLDQYCFIGLERACQIGNDKEMGESFAKFGKHCYDLMNTQTDKPSLSTSFINSILSGMALGSSEAVHYFPCLLKSQFYENDEEARQFFISKCKDVQSWLFLPWQAQIMSYLSQPDLADLLVPIVQRLVDDYPNGVMFNFKQTYESEPELRNNPAIRKMYNSLFNNSKIEVFMEAMHYVCQPELFLENKLKDLVNLNENHAAAIDSLIDKVFAVQTSQDKPLLGSIYNVLKKYHSHIIKLKTDDWETQGKCEANNLIKTLPIHMKERLKNVKRAALQLRDYSPYLSSFSGNNLEIELPGQYNGSKKPMPQYHVKIAKFDRFVQVMRSKCSPIKINIIGNDAKSYGFLVKSGEDLRQDQRLQQMFEIINKTLDSDANCKRKYLSVNTYLVVPLSTSLGLIQWVDDTKLLLEFIQFSMTDKTLIDTVSAKYRDWIMKTAKTDSISDCYKKALLKYRTNDVVSKMTELINQLDGDYLRKTFMMLSPSLECFISLRHNFVTSYATMCTVHWLAGVGDRHLENILIEVKTGKCYGIDFELSFGAGIDQSIPELVPFRLTPQILGLLKPFDETSLFGITMSHVLQALRKEQGPMRACLDVFIHEPINTIQGCKELTGSKKTPKEKINIVDKKLSGMKPSNIFLEELLFNHSKDPAIVSKYKCIINGEDYPDSVRSKLNNMTLTPEEQVQCLLEQAKDLNLLGRMYYGWCPCV